jgi:hypothetical protein
MIRNQLVVLLSVLSICLFSCGNSETEKQEKLHLEIMAVHDEVMPKQAELNRLKRQLKSYKDVVSDENADLKDSLINGILLLSKSEDMMTDWMSSYDYPNDSLKSELMIKYLTGQKDSINLISENFKMSITIAQGFLKNAPDSIKKSGVKSEMSHDHH